MPDNNPALQTGSNAAGASGQEAEPGSRQEDTNQRYWFHILLQDTPVARNLHTAKLANKAWQQLAAEEGKTRHDLGRDDFIKRIWEWKEESGGTITSQMRRLGNSVDWDTVIILSETLPANADSFKRLALVAHNDPEILNQARSHFRQLRALGIQPRVHDQRKR